MKTITEWCSCCEKEVEIDAVKYKLQKCPNCRKPIRACSMCCCDNADCIKCSKKEAKL